MTTRQTVASYLPFEVEVSAVHRLSVSFVRVTFSSPDLVDFDDGGPLGTQDTRVKIIIPAGRRTRAADLDVTDPGWYRRWLAHDPDVRGHMRTYTARAARLDTTVPELDIDFVLHLDQDGGGGPATTWAARAQVGQRLTILGPNRRSDDQGRTEFRPPASSVGQPLQLLLAGDETALPAIGSILETVTGDYTGTALIEVPSAADIQHLVAPPGMDVTFLPRAGRTPGEQLHLAVEQAISTCRLPETQPRDAPEVDIESSILWETQRDTGLASTAGPVYAWVAGEAAMVRDIRRSLVGTHGVPPKQAAFMGYWRRGRAET